MPHALKTYGATQVQLHAFLTFTLDGSVWSAALTGLYTSRKELLVLTGQEDRRLMGPRLCWEEKNLLLLLGIEPKFLSYPAHSLVTILTELSMLHCCYNHYYVMVYGRHMPITKCGLCVRLRKKSSFGVLQNTPIINFLIIKNILHIYFNHLWQHSITEDMHLLSYWSLHSCKNQ
jgi:hypothetical protein